MMCVYIYIYIYISAQHVARVARVDDAVVPEPRLLCYSILYSNNNNNNHNNSNSNNNNNNNRNVNNKSTN